MPDRLLLLLQVPLVSLYLVCSMHYITCSYLFDGKDSRAHLQCAVFMVKL